MRVARLDPHSYADDAQPVADFLSWRASVDFPTRTIAAEATLRLQHASDEEPLDLDTRDLRIDSIVDQDGGALPYALAEREAILGQRLRIELRQGTQELRIRYTTAPHASALQWLEPE